MFCMCNINCNSNDCERRLFIVLSLYIMALSDLVLQLRVQLLLNFNKFFMKSLLIGNIYFIFLYQLLITPFYKATFKMQM